MNKINKGQKTRLQVITISREVFNNKGISITLNELATHSGVSVSMITNHFRTKDHLFVAIAKEYEIKYTELMSRHFPKENATLRNIVKVFSMIMDLQKEYKCAILAVLFSNKSQHLIYEQVVDSYTKNAKLMEVFLRMLIDANIIRKDILRKDQLEVFIFQFVTLFTSWLAHLEVYDWNKGYQKMKPVYLKGILNCFLPYFTVKGMNEYKKLKLKVICKTDTWVA